MAVAGALLTGCAASTEYYHPKKPTGVWDADYLHCRDAADWLIKTGRNQTPTLESEIAHCMQAKGYVYDAEMPAPAHEEAMAEATDDSETEYNILESTWHSQTLAEQRRAYLLGTNVPGVFIRKHETPQGTWWRVLVGQHERLSGAKQIQYDLWQNYGLRYTYIVKRDGGYDIP